MTVHPLSELHPHIPIMSTVPYILCAHKIWVAFWDHTLYISIPTIDPLGKVTAYYSSYGHYQLGLYGIGMERMRKASLRNTYETWESSDEASSSKVSELKRLQRNAHKQQLRGTGMFFIVDTMLQVL